MTTKILDGCRRKEKKVAIFFNIKKAYNKINRNKILTTREHGNTGRKDGFHQRTDW